ncbi:serine/threonine protein kinase [Nocardioides sp. HDW12B]|uniref:serine/threonine-protein kinase n=1 Tax=Nocardioides sp. HDW12B TaxID=2714939 RepID=UPI00140B37A9|nr:serine/threonine-protein kinase [Nocardioides sp. HDW12B]QIK67904.1 serine/threonine protein kinase [Nocardioides sp. HDW12B]
MTALDHPRYRQERLIAVGGMGEVWEATDNVLKRPVALKVLKPEYAGDATFRTRFETEARHAAALSHPNVAGVLDYGEAAAAGPGEPERPYLVMELVRGEPLSALLRGGRSLDPRKAAELIAQAATGLEAAHRLGIVHRDIKPGNLLVTPDGQVKITDFGISRAADAVPLTQTGQVIGTPHYLSPEQAEGKEATPASDVYALGVVLYECLAGQRPFTADSPVGVALAHVRDPAPGLPTQVPAALRSVVAQTLSKDPAERPRSAAALAEILRGDLDEARTAPTAVAAAGPSTRVLPTGAPTRVAPAPTAPARAAGPAGPAGAPRRSRRPSPLVVGLAALALVLLGLWLASALQGDDDPTAEEPGSGSAPSATQEAAPTQSAEETPQETAPEPEPEPEPETVTVDEEEYVGDPADDAEQRLEDLGLKVKEEKVDNDGSAVADTVAYVDPSGEVPVDSEVTLGVYDDPEVEAPTEPPGGGPPDDKGKGDKGKP